MHLDFIMLIWYFRPMARGRISYPCTFYNVNMPRLWNWHMNSLIFFCSLFCKGFNLFKSYWSHLCFFPRLLLCNWCLNTGNWLSGKQRRREKMRERKRNLDTLRWKNTRPSYATEIYLSLYVYFSFLVSGFMTLCTLHTICHIWTHSYKIEKTRG